MRSFSTSAKALLKFAWNGMNKESKWEDAARKVIENNQNLPSIEVAKVKGKSHKSKDPKGHVSMVLRPVSPLPAVVSGLNVDKAAEAR